MSIETTDLEEILIPEDNCLRIPGDHCSSCLSDFEDSSYTDMNCCSHTQWRDDAKAKIQAILEAKIRDSLNGLLEKKQELLMASWSDNNGKITVDNTYKGVEAVPTSVIQSAIKKLS